MIDNISQYGGGRKLTEAEKKVLQEQLDKITEEADNYVRETTNYWKNWTSDFNAKMNAKLAKFSPGFPFNK